MSITVTAVHLCMNFLAYWIYQDALSMQALVQSADVLFASNVVQLWWNPRERRISLCSSLVLFDVIHNCTWKVFKICKSQVTSQSPALTVVCPCSWVFLPSALDSSSHAVQRTQVTSPKLSVFPQNCNCVCEEEMKFPKLTIIFSVKSKISFYQKAVKVCIWGVLAWEDPCRDWKHLFERWIYSLIVEVKPFCRTTWGSIKKLLYSYCCNSLSLSFPTWLLLCFCGY